MLVLGVFALSGSVRLCTAAEPGEYLSMSDTWYQSREGRIATANILSWQAPHGSWPKNTDTMTKPFTGKRSALQGTFDNRATTDELRFIARACRATKSRRCKEAFVKGLNHILVAQYPTGGWPQFYPPTRSSLHPRHIAFNANTMVRLMLLLRDVATSPDYAFIHPSARKKAQASFNRGILCILKCQIVVNEKKTVWCAQHDERTLQPRRGRTFELVSLSGWESAHVLSLLMSIDNPSQKVVDAIVGGVQWYESAKVTGDDRITAAGVTTPGWARFYDIPTNRPIFTGLDGVKKFNRKEIKGEPHEDYMWWGQFGDSVAGDYKKWKPRHLHNPRVLLHDAGLSPCQLRGPLRTAYDSLLRKWFGSATVALKRILDKPDKVGWKEFATAEIIMKSTELQTAALVGRLDKLEKIGDYYSLKTLLYAKSRNLQGLPEFDKKNKRWRTEMGTKKWRLVTQAGAVYNTIMLSAARKVTPPIIKRLEDFAAQEGKSLYGAAARDAAARFKANPKESAPAIRQAYFKALMEQ